MEFSTSLKNNRDFRRLYTKGKSVVSPLMAVYCRPNRLGKNRVGITVSTKIGNAVVRNRIRRRLREIYRLSESAVARGYDIVIVARTKSRYSTYKALEADVLRLFGKLGLRAEAK